MILDIQKDAQEFLEVIKKYIDLNSINTVVEFGSCDLLHANSFACLLPQATVYTFECNPRNIIDCRSKVEQLNNPRIHLIEKAVVDFVGEIDFWQIDMDNSPSKNAGASSIYKINHDFDVYEPMLQTPQAVKVPCTDFYSWAKDNNIAQPDILWVDIQGAEFLALKGMKDYLKNVKAIQIEVEFKEVYLGQHLATEVDSFLKSQGFVYLKHTGISNGGLFSNFMYVNQKYVSSFA